MVRWGDDQPQMVIDAVLDAFHTRLLTIVPSVQ